MQALARFGEASVLKINAAKAMAVPLFDGATIDPELLHDVLLLQAGERCRYLGVLIGEGSTVKDSWDACLVALNSRLARARRKTNTVRSRAATAAVIVIPKAFDPGMDERRAGEDACVRSGANGPAQIADDILLAERAGVDEYLTPARRDASLGDFTVAEIMWKIEEEVVCGVRGDPIDSTNAGYVAVAASLLRLHLYAANWDGDCMQVDANSDAMRIITQVSRGRRLLRGPFCHEWIDRVGLDTRQWLIDSSGKPANISLLRRNDTWGTLRDLLSCTWIRNGLIKFKLRRSRTPSVRRAVSDLWKAMVCNYPELLIRPHTTMHLRPIGAGA
ncbi:unnamed protein product [Hyaloperonospora brassicae]|nr:unnamed protein product [Hyaloperonospora brassicae]